MLVVSNTSPLSNLAIIGHLDLLRKQFSHVVIPSAVKDELSALRHNAATATIKGALSEGWLEVRSLSHPIAPDISHGLHRGESEALALALEIKADLVLLDDGDARLRASRLGLSIGGVLGVLLKARKAGDITSFRGEMERLRSEARFFISPALANQLLAAAEE